MGGMNQTLSRKTSPETSSKPFLKIFGLARKKIPRFLGTSAVPCVSLEEEWEGLKCYVNSLRLKVGSV